MTNYFKIQLGIQVYVVVELFKGPQVLKNEP